MLIFLYIKFLLSIVTSKTAQWHQTLPMYHLPKSIYKETSFKGIILNRFSFQYFFLSIFKKILQNMLQKCKKNNSFFGFVSFQTHLNYHIGCKPYICPHPNCGKSFTQSSNMRTHSRKCEFKPADQQ